jgi:glycosyltransferase involved in cell wall biosynthesis
MKNVLILNPYISTLGGGEKTMGYFCKSLEEYYNYDVIIDILVFNTYGVDVFAEGYIEIEDLNKQFGLKLKRTRIKKIDIPFSKNRMEAFKNKLEIEKVSRGYDIFVNFMFLSKHIGHAKKNIYQCFFPPKRYAKEWQGKGRIIGILYDFLFYRSYNVCISDSKFANHWLTTYWKPHKKNIVIYPPVFSEKEMEGRYIESEKKNIIISVGRFFVGSHSKKQLDMAKFFIHNSDKLAAYEYHIVGAVSEREEDREYLRKVEEVAKQSENIKIHVNCKYEELIALYRAAKIFWHATGFGIDENREPEKTEHFGITTVEAMSFGAVPVVINKGGQRETVEEGVNGYRWDDEKDCIEKTYKLIEDDDLRRRMAEESVRRAKGYSTEEYDRLNREVFHGLKI